MWIMRVLMQTIQKKTETIPIDFLKDLITEYENGTNCEKLWAVGLTCAIQKYKAQEKREK